MRSIAIWHKRGRKEQRETADVNAFESNFEDGSGDESKESEDEELNDEEAENNGGDQDESED